MATSTNYGWAEPDNSSLVKNGASDIRTLGNAIDASLWNVGYGNAGKNKIINGAFDFWQRGTSFSVAGSWVYTSDRFQGYMASGTSTLSQQTFTAGTAPVSGYEGTYFLRATAPASGGAFHFRQSVEDVRTFAGQTVTLSFWAKASTATTFNTYLSQNFGSGGSATVSTTAAGNAVTTSWTRFTYTVAVPSISGKTIGTSSFLDAYFVTASNFTSSATLDIWGVQLEVGSTATPFSRNASSIQGELAACQRYYQRFDVGGSFGAIGNGSGVSTTVAYAIVPLKTTMRLTPTTLDRFGTQFQDYATGYSSGTFAIYAAGSNTQAVTVSYTHGSAALTQYRPYALTGNGATDYVGFGAEL